MKFFLTGITVILLVTAVFAGCTSPNPPASSVATPEITQSALSVTTIPMAATAGQPATTVPATRTGNPNKAFIGDYRWAEYRNNITQTLPPNPRYQWEMEERVERSGETYRGTPAIHYRITQTSDYTEFVGDILTTTKNGQIFVDDSYYDISTNQFLGETTTQKIKGVVMPVADNSAYSAEHHREDGPGGWMGITPFGEMNITLADTGTESITVPAGTYQNARTYSGAFRDGTSITFWVVPGIPVPVRYQFPNKNLDGDDPFQSYELKSWG